jgi:Fe-S cluster biogenesis protein NfuA
MAFLRRLFHRDSEVEMERGPLFHDVQSAMSDVQAYARSHGGEIKLLGVSEEGDVKIRLTGTCRGCPMSAVTIRLGVENNLRRIVPGVRKIVQVP